MGCEIKKSIGVTANITPVRFDKYAKLQNGKNGTFTSLSCQRRYKNLMPFSIIAIMLAAVLFQYVIKIRETYTSKTV